MRKDNFYESLIRLVNLIQGLQKGIMANIKDVAELAGVSITTVSHVINQTRYVSEELTKRV